MEDGDLYSYATVTVGTHGFVVRTNEGWSSPIEIITSPDPRLKTRIDLIHTKGVEINVDDIDKLIRDQRSQDAGQHILVYQSGKAAEQVMELIKPQLREVLMKYRALYQSLVDNAEEMITAVDANLPTEKCPDYFCRPMQQENNHG